MDFTPKQKYTLLSKMGYEGSPQDDEMELFIQSQPGVAARMGKFGKALQKKVGMAEGGAAESPPPPAAGGSMYREDFVPGDEWAMARSGTQWAPPGFKVQAYPDGGFRYVADPSYKPPEEQAATTAVAEPEWQPTFSLDDWDLSNADNLQQAQQAYEQELAALRAKYQQTDANTPERRKIEGQITKLTALDPMNFAREGLQAKAITDPSSLVTTAEVDKVTEAQGTVIDPTTGQVQGDAGYQASTAQADTAQQPGNIQGQTYDASTVDAKMQQAISDTATDAATSEVGKLATVQGQMEELMKDFEDGTPPWASGAMRAASARMQARGMGASSVAGKAIVQAAMEAAVPIAVADAQTYAQREMANLSNEQQTRILKTQFRFQGLLSDQAAENAAKQFNATSKNQVDMFRENLTAQIAQFNSAQINAMRESNVNAQNAAKQFNEQIKNQREMFNAQNSLQIAQANAQWRQFIETANTSAQNQANMDAARISNAITMSNLDSFWQEERDLMAFAFQNTESMKDRSLQLLIADKQIQASMMELQAQLDAQDSGGFGKILGSIAGSVASGIFSDRRLKKNIEFIETRDDGLNVYMFQYKWSNRNRIGFMADEVREIYPEAVIESTDGILYVDYSKVPGGSELDIYGLETDVQEST